MCEFEGKLVAWMDGELPDDAAAAVEAHIGTCAECRERVSAYERVSSAFVAYRDSAARARLNRSRSNVAWLAIATTIAAALALLLLAPHVPSAPQKPLANARGSVATLESMSALPSRDRQEAVVNHKVARRRRARPAARDGSEGWVPDFPTVPIAISADALFAPGAIPDGIGFRGDLSIAADGSPQSVRLRP